MNNVEKHNAEKFELHSAFHASSTPIEYKSVQTDTSPFIRVNGKPYYRNKYYVVTVRESKQIDRLLDGNPIWIAMKTVSNGCWKFKVRGELLPSFFEIATAV